MRASVVYVPTRQRANLPKACQLLTFNKRAKAVPIIQFGVPKGAPIFQLFFKRIFDFEFFNYA